MKQQNSYAAGRKVYGGGRSNPTSGTVNPSGYIDRAMNKKASTRRSGLAAMAIGKIGPWKSSGLNQNLPAPAPIPPSSPTGENVTPPQQAMPVSQPVAGPVGPWKSPGLNQNLPTPTAPVVPQPTRDVVDPNWEPPIDPEAEANAAAYEAERQRFLVDLQNQEINFRSAAGRRIRDLDAQRPRAQEQLLGDFAGRGLAYSGRYAADTGDLQNRFATQITDTNEDLTNNLAQISSARGAKNSEIQALLNRNNAQSAARNADNPAFRAPVYQVPLTRNTGIGGPASDELAIEAIKRRLAQGVQ